MREGIALVGLYDELVFSNAAMGSPPPRMSMPIAAAIGADRGPLPAEFDGDTYFADWEAVLADSDEPTADELAVSGFVLERYTAPIDDARGARIGRLVVLRDVTREREVDQLEVDAHADRLARAAHTAGERGRLHRAADDAEFDEARRGQFVEVLHQEGARLTSLVDEFLDLQPIETGRQQIVPVPTDLGACSSEARPPAPATAPRSSRRP